LAASADPERVREWWLATPLAAIVLPVGWHVDVIDAPEAGGREALGRLEMMGYRPAPTISTASGRLLFLVAAGARRTADFAERGRGRGRKRVSAGGSSLPTQPGPETGLWLGGDCSGTPDIVVRRRGVLVLPPIGPEPPGVTRWLVEPDQVRRPLPRAEDLLGPIVHACRDVSVRRQPPSRPGGEYTARLPARAPSAGATTSATRVGAVAECALAAVAPPRPDVSRGGPWQARVTARGPGSMPAAVAPALAGATTAGSRPGPAQDASAFERAPAVVAAAALSAAHPTATGSSCQPAWPAGPARPAEADARLAAPRPVPRRAGPSAVRSAGGTAGRRVADRRSEAAGAAWKERLRRVRPEPPPAPA
jgi:hypothetical protein